jgi:multiple sugar transport system permease protein
MTAAQVAGEGRPRSVGSGRLSPGSILGNGVMVIGLLYFVVPLLWLFLASTKSNSGLFSSFGFWFDKDFNLFQNLQDLMARDNGAYAVWMRNTVIYAVSASVGSTFIAALAGYAFAVYRFRGRNLLFAIILGSVFVPTTILAVPLYFMLGSTGLSNSLLAVILPGLVNPFGVYLMRIYAERAVPDELLDAARVDGAGELRIFATIASRLLAPGLVTVLLFAFVGAWNNFFLPLLVLRGPNVYLLSVGLNDWNGLAAQPGQAQVLYAIVITGSAIAVLPVMLAFLFLQRYWRAGLSLGGVKA